MYEALDFDVVEHTIRAIESIHAPNSSSETRRQATQYIDSIKSSPLAPLIGHYLFHKHNKQSDIVRFQGLRYIEEAVNFKWTKYQENERLQLRDWVVGLINQSEITEPKFIKEKLAHVCVEIVKRLWPSNWNDFNELLQRLYVQNPSTQEMTLLILKSLTEDIFIYEDVVASARKHELVAEMNKIFSSSRVLNDAASTQAEKVSDEHQGWLFVLVGELKKYQGQIENQISTGSNATVQILEILTTHIINLLCVTIQWVSLNTISDSRILPLLSQSLISPSYSIRINTIDTLIALFSRNIPSVEEKLRYDSILKPLFEENGIEYFIRAWAAAHGFDVEGIDRNEQSVKLGEADYLFVKRLANALGLLGENYICHKTTLTIPVGTFTRYLQEMLVILDHPSLVVSEMTISFWCSLLRFDALKNTPVVLSNIPLLLKISLEKLSITEESNDVTQHYSLLDFVSNHDFKHYLTEIRRQHQDVIKFVAANLPLDTFQWIADKVTKRLTQQPDPSELNNLTTNGECTELTRFHLHMNAEAIVLGIVLNDKLVSNVVDEDAKRRLHSSIQTLLQLVIQLNTTDPLLVRKKITLLMDFSGVMKFDNSLILPCLSNLFTYITYTQPAEIPPPSKLSKQTLEIRSKSCHSIVKIGALMPDLLITIYNDLQTSVFAMIEEGKVDERQYAILMEFLVCIIYFTKKLDVQEKMRMFDGVVNDVVTTWATGMKGPLFDSGIEDGILGVEVMRVLGVGYLEENRERLNRTPSDTVLDEKLVGFQKERYKISTAINVLNQLMSKTCKTTKKPGEHVPELWTGYISRILPNIFNLIRGIHSLYDNKIWIGISVECTLGIIGISDKEKNAATGQSKSGDEVKEWSELDLQLRRLQTWLMNSRVACYQIIGQLTNIPDFYTFPNLGNLFNTRMFSYATAMYNSHWNLLIIHAVTPYVLNCPRECFNGTVALNLPPFLDFLRNKLDAEWNLRVERGILLASDEDERDLGDEDKMDDISDDMIEEKILRDVTRALSKFITNLFTFEVADDKLIPKYKDLCNLILSSKELSRPFLTCVTRIISYKDSNSAINLLSICLKLTKYLYLGDATQSFAPYHLNFFANDLVRAALECLHDPYHKEVHSFIIPLLTTVYVALIKVGDQEKLNIIRNTFASLPGRDLSLVEKLEKDLIGTQNSNEPSKERIAKQQRAITKNFLQGVEGLEVSQLFKEKKSFLLNDREFRKGDPNRKNILNEQENEDGSIKNLFG